MTAIDLITALPEMNICLWTDGENIRYRSPGALSENLTKKLRDYKGEIINFLSSQSEAFLVKGYSCDCGNNMYIPKAYIWLGLQGEPRHGYQCVSCGTRYRFI